MKMKNLLTKLGFLTLLLFFVNGIFAQTCPTGMVSYWKFEETSSTVFADSHGSNDATSDVPVSSMTGSVGNGLSLYYNTVDIPGSSFNFSANGSFTFEFWVKIPDATEGDNDYYVLLSRGDYNVAGTYWAIMVDRNTGKPSFDLRDANGNFEYVEGSTSILGNAWHHIVVVRDDAANKNFLYVDKTPYSKTFDYSGGFSSSSHIALGYMIRGGNPSYYTIGGMDELVIYNRALSQTEINSDYSKGQFNIGICDGYSPKIISLPSQKAQVGSVYNYKVIATGLPTITYSLPVKPTGMTINSNTGLISWTPSNINTDALVKAVAYNPSQAPADTQTFRIFLGQVESCPANLLFLLKLDEASGPTYADHYTAHNGTATVAPTATGGKIGLAQQFNGSSTGIDIPDNGTEYEFSKTSSFSIEAWLKTSSTATQIAVARNRQDYGDTVARWFVGTDAGKVMFGMRDNSSDYFEIQSENAINDGAWHHVVAVRDGAAGKMTLIVDGTETTENKTFGYSFYADDPTPLTIGYMLRPSGNQYYFDGAIDEVGLYTRVVTVSEVATYLQNPTGHCAVNNYAPAIVSTPKTTASENVPYSYQFVVEDIDDDDVITLSAPTKPSWLNFNFTPNTKTATLSGTPGSGNVGNHNVTLRVSDGTIQKDQTFTINVANVNDAPEITSAAPPASVDEDAAYSYTLTVTDADVNDVIGMTVVSKPSWLAFTYSAGAKTATLSGTPLNGDEGGHVEISITDQTVTVPFEFDLTVNPINDAPVITGQNEITVDEETVVYLDLNDFTITDVDNPASDLSLEVLPGQHYTFENDAVTPDANFNGTLTVNVKVHDLATESANFACQITYTPVNDAPVITSVPIDSIYMNNLYAYVLTASDVDNQTLTYSVIDKPDWLNFSAASGVLTGTPTEANIGEYLIQLRVSDGTLNTDQNFILEVAGHVAVSSFDAEGIKVYPVPARDFLNIKFAKLSEETHADIISTNGSIVKRTVIAKDQVYTTIDLGGIESGTYLLRLTSNKMNAVGRILINK
jgi:hypothetical protein